MKKGPAGIDRILDHSSSFSIGIVHENHVDWEHVIYRFLDSSAIKRNVRLLEIGENYVLDYN